jgi:hypothetical protein
MSIQPMAENHVVAVARLEADILVVICEWIPMLHSVEFGRKLCTDGEVSCFNQERG